MPQTDCRTTSLCVGAAQVDITPSAGVHLAGAVGVHRPAKLLGEPLSARAVVFDAGGRRACILALDVTIITDRYTERIRREAADRYGLEPAAVMVHATQTHSAPALGYFMLDDDFPPLPPEFEWLRGAEAAYGDWAAERGVEAIGQALERLEPAALGAGSGIEGRLAFNRRAVNRDGTVTMPGRAWQGGAVGPAHIRYIEGPMDPEVGVICARTPDLRCPAIITHYTCHPVHVFPKPVVSPDWPGALCESVQASNGPGCVGMVLNGACGNINPWPPFDPDYVEDHARMGRLLADRAQAVIETLEFRDDAELDWQARHVRIPLREVTEEELAWAEGVLGESPVPCWADDTRRGVPPEWAAAASVYSVHLLRRRDPLLDYEVQVIRLGDAAIVGLPGEPFVEGQLRIKLASPFAWTYIAHCTSHYVGYLPTREALQRGGHEVNTRYWAKLVPEALDMVVEGAGEVLGAVFARSGGRAF